MTQGAQRVVRGEGVHAASELTATATSPRVWERLNCRRERLSWHCGDRDALMPHSEATWQHAACRKGRGGGLNVALADADRGRIVGLLAPVAGGYEEGVGV